MMSTNTECNTHASYRAALWAGGYTAAGLLAGLVYRELTRGGEGGGQLALMHTHLLTLGTVMMLIVASLAAIFPLAQQRWYRPFFFTYNAGVIMTVVMQAAIGYQQAHGGAESAMLNGIAGLGHITITSGFGLFFAALLPAIQLKAVSVAEGGQDS